MITDIKMSDLVAEMENSENLKEFFDKHILQKRVSSTVDVYMTLIESEVPQDTETYKADLQKDFLDYVRSHDIQLNEVATADCITKTAFSRLRNASENYYMGKLCSAKSDRLQELKQKAEQMKKEYELVKGLR